MISETSRYRKAIVYYVVETGEWFVGTRQPVNLPPADDDTFLYVRQGETLCDLAYRKWGANFGDAATDLFWVLADVNGIVNPLLALEPGRRLRAPSSDRLLLEVFE